MYTDPCTIALQTDKQLMAIQESKFLVYGRDERKQMNDCLAYIATNAAAAVARCQELHPDFVVNYVEIDQSEVEVVKVQSLV